MKDMKKATAKATIRRAMKTSIEPMRQRAEDLAPTREDPTEKIYYGPAGNRRERKYGTTKFLIQVSEKLTPRQAAKARKEGKSFTVIYMGTRDRAARLVEWGHARAVEGGGFVIVPAHPFMRPAFDQEAEPTLRRFGKEMWVEIEKTQARAARRAARKAGR
ncbi:HK97-gp10 family putative phage morphogenesis protein [Sphingobium ummariense]